jgi:hypothetical protein
MLRVGACVNHDSGALKAGGQRLSNARRCHWKEARWHLGGGNRSISRCFARQGGYIGRAEQPGQVGRVNRRRFDTEHNVVRSGRLDLSLRKAETKLTRRRDLRPQLK